MQRGEIRQVSIAGITVSPYTDWVTWKKSDQKWGWFFVVLAILFAYVCVYGALQNPRKTASALKKKKYVDEVIPEIKGHQGALLVTIQNMPVWREIRTSKTKYPPDFGSDLVGELLASKKVTFENLNQAIQNEGKFVINFQIEELPEMSIEISGTLPTNKNQFESNFLDAISNAWQQNNIKY
jgi:hypothetical protein